MHSDEFEGAYSDFIDGLEYEQAENALVAIVRLAFEAGWRARGDRKIVGMILPQDPPSHVDKTEEP